MYGRRRQGLGLRLASFKGGKVKIIKSYRSCLSLPIPLSVRTNTSEVPKMVGVLNLLSCTETYSENGLIFNKRKISSYNSTAECSTLFLAIFLLNKLTPKLSQRLNTSNCLRPKIRLDLYKKSLAYSAARIWNNLPDHSKLKRHFFFLVTSDLQLISSECLEVSNNECACEVWK